MPFSLADARFALDRSISLLRRGATSLGTRGWRATWQRVTAQLGLLAPPQRRPLLAADPSPFSPFSVPCAAEPRATIVIPVYNGFGHTLACLRAIAAAPPEAGVEIVVVDDGSSDETVEALPQVEGLRYHRRPANGGFIAACNDGAALATGDCLVFLNNDTVPQPGWLDALLRTFEQHPGTGLVGAQLLYPDGRLQESGGLVLRDGRGESRGRFADPDHSLLRFACEVDYCSGAALAIPRALFQSLGGFDPLYAPAYYEDTDLAFRVRAAGHRVLCQPDARVVHVEGASAGNDLSSGMKSAQLRNQPVFAGRWAQVLASHPDSPPDSLKPVADGRQVLVIDALTPTPDRDSGSLRMVNLMRLLREEGAHVVFVPADRRHAGEDTERLQALGIEAWYAPHMGGLPAWLKAHGPRFSSVIASRHYVARGLLPLLRKHAPQARLVFDSVDLHYLRERRAADLAGDARLQRTAMRTQALELDVMARSDVTLVVSPAERELLARDAPQVRVEVISNLHQVAGAGRPFEQRRDLVFVGGFRHPPNVDAVRWFVESVFARVRAALPDVRFHCIGGDLVPEIEALREHPGVLVHGYVPDITPYMDGCRIAIAPLRYGAGVKGKINLSMAHGQPVVATATAVEGMHLRHGHDVLVADDADGFADAVIRLYGDATLWMELSIHGHENIRRHFSPDAARATVREVFFD
ncbi:glycosyltransferase [Luteimonas dalianensis]|uniref:glycosyltransferase n=1 Tax=Luteimonas dalianensis TaxID=1148196 RepID=UPI003BF43173